MTKFDHLYMDPEAEADLRAQVDLVDEWQDRVADPWKDALSNPQVGNRVAVNGNMNMNVALASSFRPVEICRIQVPAHLSRPWVVTWSPLRVPFPATVFDVNLISQSYVVLRWGAGGAQHQALVDWGNGGQATLYGSYVQVLIQPFGMLPPPVQDVVAQASIAPGKAPERPLQMTQYYGAVNAGATVTRPVPAFAVEVQHYWDQFTGPTTNDLRTTVFEDINGNPFVGVAWAAGFSMNVPHYQAGLQLVPGNATQLRYVNGSANNHANVVCIYRLAL